MPDVLGLAGAVFSLLGGLAAFAWVTVSPAGGWMNSQGAGGPTPALTRRVTHEGMAP